MKEYQFWCNQMKYDANPNVKPHDYALKPIVKVDG